MPGFILHAGATLMCPHGGQVQSVPTNPRVLVCAMPASVLPDAFLVAGCPLNVSGAPQPCLRVQWTAPAARVLVNGAPVLLQSSVGLTLGPTQAPQGVALAAAVQARVGGM
jgi:hypothetical protein